MPCIETYQKVDLRTITLGVPPQEVFFKCINFYWISCCRFWPRTVSLCQWMLWWVLSYYLLLGGFQLFDNLTEGFWCKCLFPFTYDENVYLFCFLKFVTCQYKPIISRGPWRLILYKQIHSFPSQVSITRLFCSRCTTGSLMPPLVLLMWKMLIILQGR